jgi:hypothetical protein
MSTAQLRQQGKALIDSLSAPQLRVASEFLAFVKSRDLDPAALELLFDTAIASATCAWSIPSTIKPSPSSSLPSQSEAMCTGKPPSLVQP